MGRYIGAVGSAGVGRCVCVCVGGGGLCGVV